VLCCCNRSKAVRGRPASGVAGKQSQVQVSGSSGKRGKSPGERPEKVSRHARGYAPYHRRLTFTSRDTVPSTSVVDVTSLSGLKTSSQHGVGVPGGQSHGATTAADSPHSAAPSPLTATQAQQPPGNPVADPPMPTLSPHPPPKLESRDTLSSLLTSGNQTDADHPSAGSAGGRLSSSVNAGEHKFSGGIIHAGDGGTEHRLSQLRCPRMELRRPILTPMFDGENDEELVTTSFYDYSPDSVWVMFDDVGSFRTLSIYHYHNAWHPAELLS